MRKIKIVKLQVSLVSFLLLLPTFSILFSHTAYALAGDGSSGAPFQISNCADLRAMDDIDGQEGAHFALTQSFSCSAGGDFQPIGKDGNGWDYDPLTGEFDGNGFTISDVTINDTTDVGLFYGLQGANVHDLTLSNITVNTYVRAGGLAGYSTRNGETNTLLENITVNGSVNGGYSEIGGLIGSVEYTDITNAAANVDVVGGCQNIGGAFGILQTSNVVNSSSTGNVIAEATECQNAYIGGFAGSYYGDSTDTVENSYSTGNITADNGVDYVGGFVGQSACIANYNNSYATGTVSGRNQVGGFVGQDGCMGNGAKYNTVYATGEVTGLQDVGGLIGAAYVSGIHQSKASGNVHGDSNVGGLVGTLTGSNSSLGYVTSESFATGNVYGNNNVGGFAGNVSEVFVSDNYSRGSVAGDGAGGFFGATDQDSTIINNYSTGLVTPIVLGGGFAATGSLTPPIYFSFWDTQTSGLESSLGGVGKTTSQMKTLSTFTDELSVDAWNFDSIWGIRQDVNDGYPCLLWDEACSSNDPAENDGVSFDIEQAAPKDGDANDDGFQDADQSNVTSLPSSVSGKYAVLQTSCASNQAVSISSESTTSADAGYSYTAGLVNFTATGCGSTATITQYFYGNLDASKVTARKFNSITKTYTTIPGAVITNVTIGGQKALKIVYTVADNGPLDEDPATGTITDPSGPAVLAVGVPNTGIQGGRN